ncbi:hypothetical protein Agub_g11055, partial [Astrephomene gubernaculifera]
MEHAGNPAEGPHGLSEVDLTADGATHAGQAEALALSSPLLLPYERQLVEDALQDDCLIITAAGLGWQRIAAVLLRITQRALLAEWRQQQQQQQQEERHQQAAGAAAAAAAAVTLPPANPSSNTSNNIPNNGGANAANSNNIGGGGSGGNGGSGSNANNSVGGGGCVLVLGASPWQRALLTSELARHDPSLLPPLDITNEVPALERIQLYRSRPAGRPLFITSRILVVDLLAGRLRGRHVAGVLLLNAHRASDTSGEGFAVALLRGE